MMVTVDAITRPARAGAPGSGPLPGPAAAAPVADDVLRTLPFAVVVVDDGLRILRVNAAAEQVLDRSAAHLAGRGLSTLFPSDSPLLALISQALASGSGVSEHELWLSLPGGDEGSHAVTATPVGDDGRQVVVSLHGQSVVRRIENRMIHRHAARSVTGLAALLAHEVKNPLSGIRGAAQLLEQSLQHEEDRALSRMICEETDRICTLVDRMELFSDESFARDGVNIHVVLERIRRIAEAGFGRHVRFVEEYDPSLPPVHGNLDQLVQVFLNIVKNACEAVPADGGEIRLGTAYRHGVRLTLPGGTRRVQLPLVVSVADNGRGIPDEIAPHVFDPFITTGREGTGLGLALAAKVVGDHGGMIEFDSDGGGTVFRVRLPLHSAPETAEGESR